MVPKIGERIRRGFSLATVAVHDTTTAEDQAALGDRPLMVFSSDTHVGPRPSDLRPYCEKKYLRDFDEFASSELAQVSRYIEGFALTSDAWQRGRERNDQTAGHYDPNARLRDMDRDGVAGGVIFHNSLNGQPFPFDLMNNFANGSATSEERLLVGVGRTIYNRWLSDFCSIEPERSIGLAQLPLWDIDASIKELQSAAEAGLRGVNFPAPGQPGMLLLDHPKFEDFYAVCAGLDMTLATHVGAVPPEESRLGGMVGHALIFLDTVEWGLRTIWQLTFLGAFERHPNLKLVLTEHPGAYWDEMNAKMDSVYYSPSARMESQLPKPPSDYTNTNVWIGNSFQSRTEAMQAITSRHEDRFLWGSDYPHAEGTWCYPQDSEEYPLTRLSLANTYHGLPLEKVRKLIGENALNAYPRLDAGALSMVAARIAPPLEEITAPPDLSNPPPGYDCSLGFRTRGGWS